MRLSVTNPTAEALEPLVPVFRKVGKLWNIEPVTLAAICWRETDFGLALNADGTGDFGHGRGLMQIDDRWHADWIKSANWRDPETNIGKGAEIYIEGLARLEDAGFSGDGLELAAFAVYNAGFDRVWAAVRAGKSQDAPTTGGDYGQWCNAARSLLAPRFEVSR